MESSRTPTARPAAPARLFREREEFKDAEHPKRSASQLVVMSLSKGTLADIVQKAEGEKIPDQK